MKTMIGTTGTTFDVVSETPAGRLGFRSLGGNQFRVRVADYVSKYDINLPGWNQPDESNYNTRRFSTVVTGTVALGAAIATAQTALVKASKSAVAVATAKFAAAEEAFNAAKAAYQQVASF